MPYYFIDFSIAFDILSGAVALLVSYYAFHYNRLIVNSTLRFISLGFLLLGVGLLVEASIFFLVAFGIGNVATALFASLGTSFMFNFLQIAAYFIFAYGYIRTAFFTSSPSTSSSGNGKGVTGTASAILISLPFAISGITRFRQMIILSREIFLISELLSIVFLAVLVFAGFLMYFENRNRLSVLVLLSFILILISHSVALWSVISLSAYLTSLSAGIQFIGFLSLLIFLLRSNQIGSARKAT